MESCGLGKEKNTGCGHLLQELSHRTIQQNNLDDFLKFFSHNNYQLGP
jgi:hypothetical protein